MAPPRGFRIERDSMGEVEVPADALWGASTQRAVENFPVSGERLPVRFVRALGLVKRAVAAANGALGELPPERARAIEDAAREVAEGLHDDQFVVDVFQTGSGTSTNMNANEVIATRAGQLLGEGAARVHPNDDVNRGQSSNDVIPTALHVALRGALHEELVPALGRLRGGLHEKAREHHEVRKLGRTHLMDAVPMRVGEEFGGWGRQVELGIERLLRADAELAELALGGTAVGTGLNRHLELPDESIRRLSEWTGLPYRRAGDPFEAQGARDAAVSASGALRSVAVSLYKIANDVRLLASGPRSGLGELALPALQPGSSIMPGKVNPVICESVTQVAAQVIGNDAAVAVGGLGGQLQLNAFLPLLARNLLESVRLLANVSDLFLEKCVAGIRVDRERAAALLDQSTALATSLVPLIGYDAAAALAHEAIETGRSIRDLARERHDLDLT